MFLDPTVIWVILGALALEAFVGYPKPIWRWIGHPVSWMGYVISQGERFLNSAGRHETRDFIFGCALLIVLIALVGGMALGIHFLCQNIEFGWIIQMVLCATLLASRSLYDHVLAVADALQKNGLLAGREAISLIVGRDPHQLDEAAISRAAVETLAENTSDGIIAPLFLGLLAGLPGIAIYKAVNTADSMIGHHSKRYEWFGKAAARMDDLLNIIPARLTGLLFVFAAVSGRAAGKTFEVMRRDAPRHLSPNAGWPEAAMAGALNCRLGGPRNYGGVENIDGAWLGDGNADIGDKDIRSALMIYRLAIGTIVIGLVLSAISVEVFG